MTHQFSAREPYLGYLYQARYALLLLLSSDEDGSISLESLDDVTFQSGETLELIQVKHHVNPMNLTDKSSDLWKTIRIWSEHIRAGRVDPKRTIFSILTTSTCPPGSAAELLRAASDRRNVLEATRLLQQAADTSSNVELQPAFRALLDLNKDDQSSLIASIHVIDSSPNIHDTARQISKLIRHAAPKRFLPPLLERLEGWWLKKVIECLTGNKEVLITYQELSEKIQEIAEQFGPNALPTDFLDSFPETADPQSDTRIFVKQLKLISLSSRRIEQAIIEYYRAFEQRSRWVREDLILGEELENYERRLIDEWERHLLAIEEKAEVDDTDEDGLVRIGRDLYNWMDLDAETRIRENVTARYILRGSYHMLADHNPPRVWWHAKFLERLETLLSPLG